MTSGQTEVDNHDLSTSSTVSSSPAISNSSSAASSSSTLPVHDIGEEQQQQQAHSSSQRKFMDEVSKNLSDTESTNVSTSSSLVPATPARKPGNKGLVQHQQDYSSVRVAVRIRPLMIREQVEMCKICTNVTPKEPQITLGYKDDKSFTYDYVYDMGIKQEALFDQSVRLLVEGILEGYNATVLAYGQTGSGKTYTMGTSFDELRPDQTGILPRSIAYLFSEIEERKKANCENPVNEIVVNAQFIELYNEEVIDLLDTGSNQQLVVDNQTDTTDLMSSSNYSSLPAAQAATTGRSKIEIHEDQYGQIVLNGCSNKNVFSVEETLEILKNGAKIRQTGSTNMNSQSSRSHAIFTLAVRQKCALPASHSGDASEEFQVLTAKFHFVDLAGSERLKRTGATGSRAKEGICINRGLLALGNVISALGDSEKIGCHVPYRDSKLTRLLQDSLGGNSRTLMIACVSPSDKDFMETLNTLRYANRARNIKNKVSVNQDKTSQKIAQLMEEIEQLKYELGQYKAKHGPKTVGNYTTETSMLHASSRTGSSSTIVGMQHQQTAVIEGDSTSDYKNFAQGDFICMINKLKQENSLLLDDNQSLRLKSKAMHETLESIKVRNCELEFQSQRQHASGLMPMNSSQPSESETAQTKRHLMEIEELRCKLIESELTCKYLKQSQHHQQQHQKSTSICLPDQSVNNNNKNSSISTRELESPLDLIHSNTQVIQDAKKDIELNTTKLKLLNEEYQSSHLSNKQNDLLSQQDTTSESTSSYQVTDINSTAAANTTEEDESSSRDSESSLTNLNTGGEHNSAKADENQERLATEIENLGVEIDVKKRLIAELEHNNKNLEKMKSFYENKLNTLTSRIRQIEDEREKLIASMMENDSNGKVEDQVRKVRAEYELKLQSLQTEVVKYQRIKSKNSEMLRTALNNEKELAQLNRDVLDMKRLKVKLMNQLKDETLRFKKEEQNRMREIAALKRDHLKKDNQIKFLEAEKRCKEIVLKRKQEQLQALRRNTTRLSDKASGKSVHSPNAGANSTSQQVMQNSFISSTVNSNSPNSLNKTPFDMSLKNSNGPEMTTIFKKKSLFSKSFQVKWQKLDQIIHGLILKKQAISLIEREMERFLEQREKISRKLNRLVERLERRVEAAQYIMEPIEPKNDGSPTQSQQADIKIEELKERIDVMKSNVDYLQDQIAECQTNIIHLDELKDGNDYMNLERFIETITTINESKYFIKKLLVLALNKGIVAAKKEYLCNELKCELEQFERDYNTQQDLLKNIINSSDNNTSSGLRSDTSNNCFDNYFKNQELTNCKNTVQVSSFEAQFEIDEIILAPQLEDSSTESEDEEDDDDDDDVDDDDSEALLPSHRRFKTQISAMTESTFIESEASFMASALQTTLPLSSGAKARQQLVPKGPQDLLYCSYSNLNDKTDSILDLPSDKQRTISNSNSNNKQVRQPMKESSNNIINDLSPVVSLLTPQQKNRICSRSYTKIPNENVQAVGAGGDEASGREVSAQQQQTESSNANLSSIPMSKSVIVTSSDSSNYKRMTRSTMSRQTSKDSFMSTSPSRSPVNHSKRFTIRNENVFNRLTSENKQSPMPERGNIRAYSGNINRFRSSPITLSHVAAGHSKAVLTLDSFDNKLVTGSKDRTAKVWDLSTGQELAALVGHNNSVTKVRYDKTSQLYMTVSSSYVKVWDLRESSTKCIKNMCSSGLVFDGNTALNMMKSTNRVNQQSEASSSSSSSSSDSQMINDLCIDDNGSYMYLAAGNTIKIWDLRQFTEIAKLTGGQNSSIMTMMIDNNQIITGSKDHYIRVFDLQPNFSMFNQHSSSSTSNSTFMSNSDGGSCNGSGQSQDGSLFNGGVIVNKYNMMPPHYDGVQSLCKIDDTLFSGSRDMCIKKWSMADHQCKQSINNAHKDWICSLDYLSDYSHNILLSGCRGGYLKMWNVNTLEKMADFRAHLCPINSIKVNKNMLFTASDDATVRIWRKDNK